MRERELRTNLHEFGDQLHFLPVLLVECIKCFLVFPFLFHPQMHS